MKAAEPERVAPGMTSSIVARSSENGIAGVAIDPHGSRDLKPENVALDECNRVRDPIADARFRLVFKAFSLTARRRDQNAERVPNCAKRETPCFEGLNGCPT